MYSRCIASQNFFSIMSSRRLSRGSSSNLGDFGGSDLDDEDISPLSEKPLARHRSSVGGKANNNGVSKIEQTRIADMYKTVIKLAAENVIFDYATCI